MGMPRFSMPPPMCIRQLLSQAAKASAPVADAKSSLSFSIAPEISGYFTEKVPPKPQQTSDCSISTSSMPGSVFSRARGWVESAEFAAEVTAFVIGYFSCRFGGLESANWLRSVMPRTSTMNSENSKVRLARDAIRFRMCGSSWNSSS